MHRKPKMILLFFIIAIVAITTQLTITGFNTIDLICIDTDGGEEVFKKGVTQGYEWKFTGYEQTEPKRDICIPFDNSKKNRVREHFCDEHKVIRKNIRCPEGTICKDGACR